MKAIRVSERLKTGQTICFAWDAKWALRVGIVLLGLGAGIFPLWADAPSAPVIVHTLLVLESDGGEITTKAQLSIPVIPIDKDRDAFMEAPPGDANDATFIAYLKALKADDSVARCKYIAMSEVFDDRSTVKLSTAISRFETDSYLPTDKHVRILGKIPLQAGAAYIVITQSKGNPSHSFLTSVLAQGGGEPKVYFGNPWTFLTVLQSSFSQANLLKDASPGVVGQILSKQDMTDFLFSRANPSAAADILKAVDFFQKHSGKDSFTSGGGEDVDRNSQKDFDKDLANLDATNQAKRIQQIAADAQSITYILDFDPIYVSVQKGDHEVNFVITKDKTHLVEGDDATFYYLRGKDGRLRFTNWQEKNEWDSAIRALPAPSAAVAQACASALKAAQGQN